MEPAGSMGRPQELKASSGCGRQRPAGRGRDGSDRKERRESEQRVHTRTKAVRPAVFVCILHPTASHARPKGKKGPLLHVTTLPFRASGTYE